MTPSQARRGHTPPHSPVHPGRRPATHTCHSHVVSPAPSIYGSVFSSSATVYGDPASVPVDESFPTGPTNPCVSPLVRVRVDPCKPSPAPSPFTLALTLTLTLTRYGWSKLMNEQILRDVQISRPEMNVQPQP